MKKLCIIGGFPRAGTRQVADMLNWARGVEIKGEVYSPSFKLLVSAFAQADLDHAGRWSETRYNQHRTAALLDAIAGISKGVPGPFKPDSKVVGFKCPRIENHLQELNIIASPLTGPVLFFYCMRNIVDNFLSCKSMFGTNVKSYKVSTELSIDSILRMLDDSRYSVHPFFLDEFVLASEKGTWLYNNIFEHALPLMSEQQCCEAWSESGNRNATQRHGRTRITSLTPDEEDALFSCPRFGSRVRDVEVTFGLRPGVLLAENSR